MTDYTPHQLADHLNWLSKDLNAAVVGDTVDIPIEADRKIIATREFLMNGSHTWTFDEVVFNVWGDNRWSKSCGFGMMVQHPRDFRHVPAYIALGKNASRAMRLWIQAGEPEDQPTDVFIAQA